MRSESVADAEGGGDFLPKAGSGDLPDAAARYGTLFLFKLLRGASEYVRGRIADGA